MGRPHSVITINGGRQQMVSIVHSETTLSTSFASVHLWLARNRGVDVECSTFCDQDPCRDALLRLGLPITAARAVICGVWMLEKPSAERALVKGRLCALVKPSDQSVRLVFDGTAQVASTSARGDGILVVDHLLEHIVVACERITEGRPAA